MPLLVNSTGDGADYALDGVCETGSGNQTCTLRAAIQEANALNGADIIHFALNGAGPHVVEPRSALPSITETLDIDGTTQAGSACCNGWDCSGAAWPVVIDFRHQDFGVPGFDVVRTAPDSRIRGLEIENVGGSTTAGYAIRSASEGGSVTCNNVHGGWGGIVSTATVGMIGGSGSNDANWAHGNEFGLTVFNGTTMQGNVTGTMADGMAPDPNGAQGIYVEGGDGCTVTGNLTSGNFGPGIFIKAGCTNTVVADNFIGRNRTDTADLCNGGGGGPGQLQDQGTNTMSGGNTFGACPAPPGCCAASSSPELSACLSRSVAPLTPTNLDDCQAWLDEQLGPGVATARWFNPDYSCADLLDTCPYPPTPTATVTDTPANAPTATAASSSTITSVPMPTDTPTASATATSQPADTVTPIPCIGDCNHDGVVAVNELILGVTIVLDMQPVDACPAFANGEGVVDIAQLITGVNNVPGGCGSG